MTPTDLEHLRRCVALAAVAVARGDRPFGSVLVAGDGTLLAERTNEVHTSGDRTAHPEFALASWASRSLTPAECAAATLYSSGESCAMCSAAQVWAGIGRLVFVLSGEMIRHLGDPAHSRITLSAREVVERSNVAVRVDGPCNDLVAEAAALFRRT